MTRLYYFNIYHNGNIAGSVRAASSTDAVAMATTILPVGSLKAKRVTQKEAVDPLEAQKKEEGKLSSEPEKSSTGENSPKKRTVEVDFSKSSASEGQPTEKQVEAYEKLKADVMRWDDGVDGSLSTVYKVESSGIMKVKTRLTMKSGNKRSRVIFIGKSGGLRAYGKKPRGTEKLMLALKDVIKFCFTEE